MLNLLLCTQMAVDDPCRSQTFLILKPRRDELQSAWRAIRSIGYIYICHQHRIVCLSLD